MKNNKTFRLRFAIMLVIFVIIAIGYFTATGIGTLSAIGFGSITLICPLGALLVMIAEQTAIPLAIISIVVALIVCIVLGKIFCAWICPIPFMSRFSRKDKKRRSSTDTAPIDTEQTDEIAAVATTPASKPSRSACAHCTTPCGKSKGMKIDSRHGILAAAIGSTLIFGFPVFCLICPIGLTFASVLLIMRLFAFGETTWTIIAFPLIILIELAVLPRWCKNFCPLGALLSLMSGANRTFRPQLNKEVCIKETLGTECNLCVEACPEGINLHNIAAGETTLNDCTKCRACADACPKHAITFPFLPAKRTNNEATPPTALPTDGVVVTEALLAEKEG